jgi:hypothetical protein
MADGSSFILQSQAFASGWSAEVEAARSRAERAGCRACELESNLYTSKSQADFEGAALEKCSVTATESWVPAASRNTGPPFQIQLKTFQDSGG